MKTSKLFRIVLSGLALFAAVTLRAQDEGSDRKGDGTDTILQQLDLSSQQQEQVRAIQKEGRAERQAILAKHGIVIGKGERPDREAMKAARPDLNAARVASMKKIAAVLDATQLAKFKELRQAQGGQKAPGEGKKKARAEAE